MSQERNQTVAGASLADRVDELTRLVNWLDQEQRANKAEIGRLRQQITSQETILRNQEQKFQELYKALVSLQGQLNRYPDLQTPLAQVQGMISHLQEQLNRQRQDMEAEARNQTSHRDAFSRSMAELQGRLDEIQRQDSSRENTVAALKARQEALITQVTGLAQLAERSDQLVAQLQDERARYQERVQRQLEEARQKVAEATRQREEMAAQVARIAEFRTEAMAVSAALDHRLGNLEETSRLQDVSLNRCIERADDNFSRLNALEARLATDEETWGHCHSRLVVLEESWQAVSEQLDHLARIEEQEQQNQSRLIELQNLAEERFGEMVPQLRKLVDELLKITHEHTDRLSLLLDEHAEDRTEIARMRKALQDERERRDQQMRILQKVISQHNRLTINELERQIKDLDEVLLTPEEEE